MKPGLNKAGFKGNDWFREIDDWFNIISVL